MTDLFAMVVVCFFAFLFEVVDSALGQGYGTLGSPFFLLLNFSPKVVVPSILVSQAFGGLAAAFLHNYWRNVDFNGASTEDMKKVYVIVACGIIGVITASFVGLKLSRDIMTAYIGCVVLVMGILITLGIRVAYGWRKLGVIGAVSAFNKGLSGGGYGPIVAGGQAIISIGGKQAVAITDLAEAPICLTGFAVWVASQGLPSLEVMVPMCVGAGVAPFLGAYITYRLPHDKFLKLLGLAILVLGMLCLLKVLNP